MLHSYLLFCFPGLGFCALDVVCLFVFRRLPLGVVLILVFGCWLLRTLFVVARCGFVVRWLCNAFNLFIVGVYFLCCCLFIGCYVSVFGL